MEQSKLFAILEKVKSLLKAGENPETIRVKILGRKGELTQVLRSLPSLSLDKRIIFGKEANLVKQEIEQLLDAAARNQSKPDQTAQLDIEVPPFKFEFGTIHPVSAMIQEMTRIFQDLSFEVVEGPELVTEAENFDSLNIGPDHPARDSHDTFYVKDSILLRTQTTAVQVLEMHKRMKSNQLPIRIVVPGKTYRRESDATHSAMFHQMDAVMVDNQTTFSDLKGCLDYFCKRLFGENVETRFRPHFFPFTEPSAEIDIRWKGKTSGSGKHTGWLEFGGCGMVHPEVLRRAGLNPRTYQGWAFGMSIERPIMLRKQVPDLRLLYNNALPILEQF